MRVIDDTDIQQKWQEVLILMIVKQANKKVRQLGFHFYLGCEGPNQIQIFEIAY